MADSPLMQRAKRTAASTERGAELLAFLQRPEIKKKLTAAARAGTPPAGAVSADLLANFEPSIHKPKIKRQTGMFIAAVLDELGFRVAQSNVRMKDALFTSGACYEERSAAADAVGLVALIAASLTKDEARQMVRLLLTRFPDHRR
jgi:hypothetical protein